MAKVEGLSTKYGIDVVPTFVYFEDGIPSIYDEESEELDSDPEAIAEWIEEQRTSSTIEEVQFPLIKYIQAEFFIKLRLDFCPLCDFTKNFL